MRMIRIRQENRIIVISHLTWLTTSTPVNDPMRSSKPIAAGPGTVRSVSTESLRRGYGRRV